MIDKNGNLVIDDSAYAQIIGSPDSPSFNKPLFNKLKTETSMALNISEDKVTEEDMRNYLEDQITHRGN